MEPLFRSLIVGVVPQPIRFPPEPFSPDDLQRAYFETSAEHRYQQFQFLPGEAGAQFTNSPDDAVVIQPSLLQVRAVIDSTPQLARERTVDIIRIIGKRLGIGLFLQTGIKIVANVAITGSARQFVSERLIRRPDSIQELGPDFFAGGVKYSGFQGSRRMAEVLLVEPFMQDDALLWMDYDAQHTGQTEVDQIATWLDEAFDFVRGPAMRLLEAET